MRKDDPDLWKDRVKKEFHRLCVKYDLGDLTFKQYNGFVNRRTGSHIVDMSIEDQGIIISALKKIFKNRTKYDRLVELIKNQ